MSRFTLFRIILGDFDFPTLEANSRVLGPIYFITYVFFVFFVLLNMFLAIINDSYSEVKSDIASQKSDFELVDYFKRGYAKIMTKMHLKKDKIVDIQQALDSADVDTDKIVNFEEWRRELKACILKILVVHFIIVYMVIYFKQKRGYSDTEIEAYFAKYDLDGNRNLSHDEQIRMREDLKAQFNRIDADMAKLKAEAEIERKYKCLYVINDNIQIIYI
jgi:polycystin 2